MPSKKKKYNARFPSGRIKKIMQSDEEIGKVAQAVPVIISRTLELFVRSLLTKTLKITNSRSAKTLSTSHMKQCIMSEHRFDFLRELVKNIPDISIAEEANLNEDEPRSSPENQYPDSDTPFDLSLPSTSNKTSFAASEYEISNYQNCGSQNFLSNGSSVKGKSEPNSVIMPALISKTRSDASSSKLSKLDSISQLQLDNSTQQHMMKTHPIQSQSTLTRHQNNIDHHQQHRYKQSQTNLSSSRVNFNFCSKPTADINYSNLSISTKISHDQLTEPASISKDADNKVLNFNSDTIINIDLSNIIPTTISATSNAIATVSKNQKDAFIVAAAPNSRNSIGNTTFFELDEDYDNI